MLLLRRMLQRSPFEAKPPERGSRRWLVAELARLVSVIVRRRGRRAVRDVRRDVGAAMLALHLATVSADEV